MSRCKCKYIGDTPFHGVFLQRDVVHFELLVFLAGTAAFKQCDEPEIGWCFAEKVGRITLFISILQSEDGVRLLSIEMQS